MLPMVEGLSGIFKSEKGNHLFSDPSVCQTHEAYQLVTFGLEAKQVIKLDPFPFLGIYYVKETHREIPALR